MGIHVYCGNRYRCQDEWKEHMRKEHEIGYHCEICNEYCLFKDDLEEHMESHITGIVYEEDLEEYTEIECRQCKKIFESEDEIEKHENEGRECDKCDKWLCHGLYITKHKKEEQCDQCGEHLCRGMSIERHKKREHGTTREEGKGKKTENQKEGEMIEDRNDGQECDKRKKWQYDENKSRSHKKNYDGGNQKRHKRKKRKSIIKKENKEEDKDTHENEYDQWEKWPYDESKSKSHKKNHDGDDRKRHKKKKRKSTGKKENKEEDKEIHKNEWKCVECEKKCDSLEEINKHIHENECGEWICCDEHLRKQKKNEERYMKKDECKITIKEPDIAKGLTENN